MSESFHLPSVPPSITFRLIAFLLPLVVSSERVASAAFLPSPPSQNSLIPRLCLDARSALGPYFAPDSFWRPNLPRVKGARVGPVRRRGAVSMLKASAQVPVDVPPEFTNKQVSHNPSKSKFHSIFQP